MEAITYSNARQNMARHMSEIVDNREAKIITRGNHPSVVMMSLDDYNSIMETCYLMSSPANAEHLRKSLEQANQGEFVDVNFDEL